MDLGATLCTRSKPDCGRCPLQARCVAHATGRTAELPVRKPKKATPEKRALMLVVIDGSEVLLEQRPGSGIWGGLLSLPEVDGHVGLDKAADDPVLFDRAAAAFGEVEEVQALLPVVHVFTHYKLHIRPFKVALAERGTTPSGHVWWKLADIGAAALPAPVKTLLTNLAQPNLFS
jgi:A/G-specific adenine glycosylase